MKIHFLQTLHLHKDGISCGRVKVFVIWLNAHHELCPGSLAKQSNNLTVMWGPGKLFYGTYGPIKFEVWHGLYMKYEIKIGSPVWTEPVDSLPTDRHFNVANTVIAVISVRH